MSPPSDLFTLLSSLDLDHLREPLANSSLGSLLLRCCNDRVGLLAHLKRLNVAKLTERQKLTNALTKLLRELTSDCVSPAASSHPVLDAPDLVTQWGEHCGVVGLLARPDGSFQHVNQSPSNHYNSFTYSTGLQQPKLDGPIVAEVARLARFTDRPVYVAFSDEDPFVLDPANCWTREAEESCNEAKLHSFEAHLGEDVLVLTTACIRGLPGSIWSSRRTVQSNAPLL